MKKKILFAAVDVGYRIELYSKFIRENYSTELEADSLSIYLLPSEHYKSKYTYEFHYGNRFFLYRWFRSFINFIVFLFRYDIFHFISGETILPRKLMYFELKIYKLLKKRVIMHFVGSDIRSPQYLYWKAKNIHDFLNGNDSFQKTLPFQKKIIRCTVKFADYILVSTPDLLELIPGAEYYPVMLDLKKYLFELEAAKQVKKNKDEIVILHSPSNIKLKGTIIIHDVLKKIQQNSNYKVKLLLPGKKLIANPKIYSVSRYELFELYKEADIVIDQLIIGWYGLQSIEALAAGKQTICYVDKHLETFLYPDCPIEIADANTLESVIIKCIQNVVNSTSKSQVEQLEWVKKYHTIESNNLQLLKAWGISN